MINWALRHFDGGEAPFLLHPLAMRFWTKMRQRQVFENWTAEETRRFFIDNPSSIEDDD